MSVIADFFRWLADTHNINYSVFYDPLDHRRFLQGVRTTIYLSVICILISLILGVVGAWLQGAHSRLLRGLVRTYVEFFRNTPPLVQLAFFYFAVSAALPTTTSVGGTQVPLIDNVGWAIISFSLYAGAFNVEIFRSGIEAVPNAMIEAAEALGYTRLQAYMYVILPLAFRISLPALNNNLVTLVKTTTLAYAIAVPELLYAVAQIWSESMNVREMMNLLLVVYVSIVAVLVWIMHRWERALRVPGYSV